jgi:hypothetical protein
LAINVLLPFLLVLVVIEHILPLLPLTNPYKLWHLHQVNKGWFTAMGKIAQ